MSLLDLVLTAASYFVEWIPNNAASSSPGEFPWQL